MNLELKNYLGVLYMFLVFSATEEGVIGDGGARRKYKIYIYNDIYRKML
jgi:hypothetical protein